MLLLVELGRRLEPEILFLGRSLPARMYASLKRNTPAVGYDAAGMLTAMEACCDGKATSLVDTRVNKRPLRRSPEYWTCPNDFDPDRFPLDAPVPNELTENFAYLPFGGGKRKCIGGAQVSCLLRLYLQACLASHSWACWSFGEFDYLCDTRIRQRLLDGSLCCTGDQFALFESVVALAVLLRRFEFSMAADAPPVTMTTVRVVLQSLSMHIPCMSCGPHRRSCGGAKVSGAWLGRAPRFTHRLDCT